MPPGRCSANRCPRPTNVQLLVVMVWALLLTACGGQTTRDGARAAAPTPSAGPPRLVEEDLVTGHASQVPAANEWGPQGDRLVRSSNGDLYTTYVTGSNDPEHFGWVLATRPAGSQRWRTLASGTTAHEPGNPPQVLLGPSGQVVVVTISPWDSAGAGAPQIWSSGSRTTTVIPGHWLTGAKMMDAGALYPSAGVDREGNIYVWEDVPCASFIYADGTALKCTSANRPGTYYWAYRAASEEQWHSEQWQSPYRQTYNFILPEGTSDLRVVGTRDILQAPAEAPYRCPNSTGYCFDRTLLAQWNDLDRPASSLIVARAARDASTYAADRRASAEDAYVDTQGRTHVLVSAVDATTHGTYENHHLVIARGGQVKDVRYTQVPYPNLSRIVQDRSGRFWIYSVGPDLAGGHRCDVFIAGGAAGDTDGTRLGPVRVLPFSTNYDCAAEERNFDVNARSGTAEANYIDGVVGTNDGRDWVHYRIALPGGSSGDARGTPRTGAGPPERALGRRARRPPFSIVTVPSSLHAAAMLLVAIVSLLVGTWGRPRRRARAVEVALKGSRATWMANAATIETSSGAKDAAPSC
jgi:hypothetical protein